MSSDGKKILLAIVGLPVFAALAALVVFSGSDILSRTLVFVFGTNLLPMLIAGIFSGLMIRAVNRSSGAASNKRWVALAPVGVLVVFGLIWYLLGIVNQGAGDAGRQFFSGPPYLLGLAIIVGVLASIVYLIMPKRSA
jgi:hypothetical protein